MRSTQYIGLNSYAKKYIETMKKLHPNTFVEEQILVARGMLGEPVNGIRFQFEDKTNIFIFEETVQAILWSGGPMIFTALKQTLVKKHSGQRISTPDMLFYQWMIDPMLRGIEFDYETGRYYV